MPLDSTVSSVLERFSTTFLPGSVQYLITLAPIFLMVLLAIIFWDLWVDYVRGKNYLKTSYSVLELKLPKDTFKSPKAMEIFLNAIHNTSDGSYFAQYWKGETRPWYSLELISVEGVVKFLIWSESVRVQGTMSALYSQFPSIEIRKIEDYTRSVHYDPKEFRIWAAEFKFTNKISQVYPIKTYIDYGLDKDPKEEFKVDPMLPLIEFMGSVGPNQQVWMQILLRCHKEDRRKKGSIFEKEDSWKADAVKEVNKILMRDPETKVAGTIIEGTTFTKMPSISEGEKEAAAAIERRIGKLAFDVGIRFLYIAKPDVFSTPFGVGGVISSMKQFNDENLNGFKTNNDKWHMRLGDPWLDYKNWRRKRYGKLALMAFKRRSYFYAPFKAKPLIMNTEEIATIYHFPGSVSQTPNLERIPSKKAQAPGNLPV
ncbi:MAG: hypothetical protein NTZ38_02200 [Candidatus Taylorbacteria bacterium]|nr:hypothetical protein [Candidatus Taylorbacteria bacterium]